MSAETVEVLKKNLLKAYKEGCSDVRETLRLLFPDDLSAFKKGDVYEKGGTNYLILQDGDGDFYIKKGADILLASDGSSQWDEEELTDFMSDKTKI